MIFGGWQKFSLIDYPGKIAAVVFTQGCPFRCPFCHNPELVNPDQQSFMPIDKNDVLDFLRQRRGQLEALVVSGGEPTLQPDLLDFLSEVKALGYAIKLDTNGGRPEILEKALARGLVDYLAMDIKSPLKKYKAHTNSEIDEEKIRRSVSLVMNSGCPYEFRTTVVREQLSPEDILQIGKEIAGARRYVLQKFNPEKTLDADFSLATTYTDEEFGEFCQELKKFVAECLWR